MHRTRLPTAGFSFRPEPTLADSSCRLARILYLNRGSLPRSEMHLSLLPKCRLPSLGVISSGCHMPFAVTRSAVMSLRRFST